MAVRSLCGGASAGANYQRRDRSAMEKMEFSHCEAYPDTWLPMALKANGIGQCQHVMLYTDVILAIIEESERFLREELGK